MNEHANNQPYYSRAASPAFRFVCSNKNSIFCSRTTYDNIMTNRLISLLVEIHHLQICNFASLHPAKKSSWPMKRRAFEGTV